MSSKMVEPFAAAFELDIEFERYVLSKAVPLIQSGGGSATLHLDDPTALWITTQMTIGRSDAQVIDELGLRPLLFGAAWKILDVLVEHALSKQGGGATRRHTIAYKVARAKAGAVSFRPLDAHAAVLERVRATYVRAEEYRHSIIHRRLRIGPRGELGGIDRNGYLLRTLSVDEQLAFCRMTQRLVACVTSGDDSKRKMTSLRINLDALSSLTGLPTETFQAGEEIVPVVHIPLVSSKELDITHVKQVLCSTFPKSRAADVIFDIQDQDGVSFLCQIEEAPDERLFISRDTMLPWLQRL